MIYSGLTIAQSYLTLVAMGLYLMLWNLLIMRRLKFTGFGEYCGHCASFTSQTNYVQRATTLLIKQFHILLSLVWLQTSTNIIIDRYQILTPCRYATASYLSM